MLRKAKKAWRIARADGLQAAYRKARRRYHRNRQAGFYQQWIRKYDSLTIEDCSIICGLIEKLPYKPLISILMPVYNVDEKWLRKAIESVTNQLYPHWELCIADDCSTKPHVNRVLEEYAAKDPRLKVVFRPVNGHISAASNSALELATGEFTALFDNDDELAKHALYLVAKEINSHPKADMIYSDEDMIDIRGKRYEPIFKPDWSLDLLYSMNFVAHLIVYRTSVLRKIGGFKLGVEGSQDYDLALRVIEEIPEQHIRHIPHVLYHWRAVPGSVAFNVTEKKYAHERARRSIEAHFERKGARVKCTRGVTELHRTIFSMPDDPPLVSMIVTGGRMARTVNNILSKTKYEPYEIIVISPDSIGGIPDDPRVKVVESNDDPFYVWLNKAAQEASGSVLCFLDASTVVKTPDWLREAVSHAIRKDIGAVGVKISYPDGRIKHAGLILGIRNGVGRAQHHRDSDDYENIRLGVSQNFSAVSIECLTVRREVFESVGGFDAENFPTGYADVDLCLRLLEKGYRNVWTPWAELIQSNEPSETKGIELERLGERWSELFERDRYFNPNLSNRSTDYSLSFPPRIGKFSL